MRRLRHPAGSGRHAGKKGHATERKSTHRGIALAAATSSLHTPAAKDFARIDPPARKPSDSGGIPTAPLVRTITKIVGVVPEPLRILIAALLAIALALTARSWILARRARRLASQRAELLEDVGLLQAALLPVLPTQVGPVRASVAYRPAEGPGAGGDFYDVFGLDESCVGVIVGDVSGHGREALPQTALLRFTLRAYLEAGLSPRETLQTAGTVLERQLGESFATVVLAIYNADKRLLTYACAGHPPPLVLGLGHEPLAPVTAGASAPIGAGVRTGTRQTIVSLPGAANVCFYTDGVTEARAGSELFGEERLAQTLGALGQSAGAQALLEKVAEQTDVRPDDMAVCVLSLDGDASAPVAPVEEFELNRQQSATDRAERFLLACGVEPAEIPRLLRVASAEAERAGAALLEVDRSSDPPRVSLLGNNVTPIHAAHAQLAATAGGAA